MERKKLPMGLVKRGNVYHACFRWQGKLYRRRLSYRLDVAKRLLSKMRRHAEMNEVQDFQSCACVCPLRPLIEAWQEAEHCGRLDEELKDVRLCRRKISELKAFLKGRL